MCRLIPASHLKLACMAWLHGSCKSCPHRIDRCLLAGAGMSLTVAVNFLMSFVIGQSFLSMLCGMRWGAFLFFAGWVAVMTLFVVLLLPGALVVVVVVVVVVCCSTAALLQITAFSPHKSGAGHACAQRPAASRWRTPPSCASSPGTPSGSGSWAPPPTT